MLSEAINSGR